jgi:protein tyrosine phosphatase
LGAGSAGYCDVSTSNRASSNKCSCKHRLTKQYEGGLLKCGNYWEDARYGPLKLELVSQTGGEDLKPSANEASGFDFGTQIKATKENSTVGETTGAPVNIKRHFMLSRVDRPNIPPRPITQIQCTAWPDFDVPESPEVLCTLIKDVDQAGLESDEQSSKDGAERPPVLVHCEMKLVS